jgi:CTP synthase (UTP-ammonia lyase)
MPLNEEQRAAARQKVVELTDLFDNDCVFRYQQAAELKKVWKYRNSNGVCFAMSFDWLRRKMHNSATPFAKPKRNFDDAKYASKTNRVQLTTKHAVLQDAYKDSMKQNKYAHNSVHLTAMVAENVVKSGLDRLNVAGVTQVHSYELQEGISIGCANTHLAMQSKLAAALDAAEQELQTSPSVGIAFHMTGDGGGHATAFHITNPSLRFFDPNVGEYQLNRVAGRRRALQFVSLLWFDLYHRFFKMDSLEFETIKYQ